MTTSNFSAGYGTEKEKGFSRDNDGQDKIARSASNSHEDLAREEHGVNGEERVDGGEPEVEKVIDEPPNGGYGWVCVACLFVMNGYV